MFYRLFSSFDYPIILVKIFVQRGKEGVGFRFLQLFEIQYNIFGRDLKTV